MFWERKYVPEAQFVFTGAPRNRDFVCLFLWTNTGIVHICSSSVTVLMFCKLVEEGSSTFFAVRGGRYYNFENVAYKNGRLLYYCPSEETCANLPKQVRLPWNVGNLFGVNAADESDISFVDNIICDVQLNATAYAFSLERFTRTYGHFVSDFLLVSLFCFNTIK